MVTRTEFLQIIPDQYSVVQLHGIVHALRGLAPVDLRSTLAQRRLGCPLHARACSGERTRHEISGVLASRLI